MTSLNDASQNVDVRRSSLPPNSPVPTKAPPGAPDMPDEQSKRERRIQKRIRAMQELVETERTFVRLLDNLVECYVIPLSNYRLITEDQHKTLFPQIQIIKGLNEKFFEDMEERQNNWDNNTTKIGDLFREFTPFFRMYQNYCNNHERAVALMYKLNKKTAFVEYGRGQRADCNGLDISSLLILPIQRIPRYRMLLTEILKNTEEHHPDHQDLTYALESVEEVSAQINDRMKEFERREQVKQIERKFTQQVNLLGPARQFVKSGKLRKVCRNGKDRLYHFFLFSDLLIYASSYGNSYNLHNQLVINNAFAVQDITDRKYDKFEGRCFQIKSSTKSFIVYTETLPEKEDWFGTITQVVVDRQSRPQADEEVDAAPVWNNDTEFDACQMEDCTNKFNFFSRRHHCRRCGKLVCGNCSKYKMENPEGGIVRACKQCFFEQNPVEETVEEPDEGGGGSSSSEDDNTEQIDALDRVQCYHDSLRYDQAENVLKNFGHGPGSYMAIPTNEPDTITLLVLTEHNIERIAIGLVVKPSGIVFRMFGNSAQADFPDFDTLLGNVPILNPRLSVERSATIANITTGLNNQSTWNETILREEDFADYPKARALYDYEGQVLGDLSLKAGDIITVIDREDQQGWWNGIINTTQGLFPSTYVEIIDDKPIPNKVDEPRENDVLVARFDYTSGGPEELTFLVNDRILLVDKDDSGWWLGKLDKSGVVGWFAPDLTTTLRSIERQQSVVSIASTMSSASTEVPQAHHHDYTQSQPQLYNEPLHNAVIQSQPMNTFGRSQTSSGLPKLTSNDSGNNRNSRNHGGRGKKKPPPQSRQNNRRGARPPPRGSSSNTVTSVESASSAVTTYSEPIRESEPIQSNIQQQNHSYMEEKSDSHNNASYIEQSDTTFVDGGDSGTEYYSIEDIRRRGPELNRQNLEVYLSPSDFEVVFGCTRDQYKVLPVWKQRMKKKEAGLF